MRAAAKSLHTGLRLEPEEFDSLVTEDDKAEWAEGEVWVASPASERQEDLITSIILILAGYVKAHRLGKVWGEQRQMRLDGRRYLPDVTFLAQSHLARSRSGYIDGPADLTVEIVSHDSVARDAVVKMAQYARHGVPEYWLIDPERQTCRMLQLAADGAYHDAIPDAEGRLFSVAVPGFWLRPTWLWSAGETAIELDALRELGV